MKASWSLLLVLLTGCSTHFGADFLDYFRPGRLGVNEVTPYGGVCIPQGPVQLAPIPVTLGGPEPQPVITPTPPAIVPPPVSLPSSPGLGTPAPLPPPAFPN